MQPMKGLHEVREQLQKDLGTEPTNGKLAEATNMSVVQVKKHFDVGRAARNKLIKKVQNFKTTATQEGGGLLRQSIALNQKRVFRDFHIWSVLDQVRAEIQKAKLAMVFSLKRMPTDEEIIEKVGISPERYHEVVRASKPVLSLHSRYATTREEYINGITDVDGVKGDNRRKPALLRLAIDDVLDSLKPKESLVIRQRYGLDGKGDKTLGEISGSLNISREMVRKHGSHEAQTSSSSRLSSQIRSLK